MFVPVIVVKLLDQSPTISEPDLDVGDGLRLINSDGRTGFGFILCLLGWRAGAHHLRRSAENRETQEELLKIKQLTWLQGARSQAVSLTPAAPTTRVPSQETPMQVGKREFRSQLVTRHLSGTSPVPSPFGASHHGSSHAHRNRSGIIWKRCFHMTYCGGSKLGIRLLPRKG